MLISYIDSILLLLSQNNHMYPDLSYFFNDILGTQVDNWTSIIKTFGFMLVVALASCGVLLKSELQRLEKKRADLTANGYDDHYKQIKQPRHRNQ